MDQAVWGHLMQAYGAASERFKMPNLLLQTKTTSVKVSWNPMLKLEGYDPVMPAYQGVINDQQIGDIIEYIKTLE